MKIPSLISATFGVIRNEKKIFNSEFEEQKFKTRNRD